MSWAKVLYRLHVQNNWRTVSGSRCTSWYFLLMPGAKSPRINSNVVQEYLTTHRQNSTLSDDLKCNSVIVIDTGISHKLTHKQSSTLSDDLKSKLVYCYCWIFRAWSFPCARQSIIRRSNLFANTLFVDFKLGELDLLIHVAFFVARTSMPYHGFKRVYRRQRRSPGGNHH